MTSRRLLLLAAALLAAALVAPAVAPAKPVKWVTYSAVVDATADYAASDTDPQVVKNARLKWATTFPSVVFEGDRAHTTGEANAPTATTGFLVSAFSSRDLGNEVATCTPTELSGPPSPGRFLDRPFTPNTDPVLALRLLSSAFPDFDGCPGQAATTFSLQGAIVEGVHTYETQFTFPREAIGMGKVIQVVDRQVTGRLCPGNIHGGLATCTLDLDATVTFTKTGEWVADDGTPADPKPAAPAVPTTPPILDAGDIPAPPVRIDESDLPRPPSPLDDVWIPLPAKKKLSRRARSLTVTVTCRADCRGTVSAMPLAGGPKPRAAAARALARSPFSARAGRPARVTLRFGAAARRAIRRAGGVRLELRATAAGRPAAIRTATVRTG